MEVRKVDTIRPHHAYLDVLEPYEPPDLAAAAERAGVQEDELIRMVANENPFGPSPRVMEALGEYDAYHYHPDYGALKDAVARYAGVAPEQVVLGNGADELIDLLVRLFAAPGESVVTCPPTFAMYRFSARVNRCEVLAVPKRGDLSLDVEAIERGVRAGRMETGEKGGGSARILFVVSPGNPSGRAVGVETIKRLLALPLAVVVDEAYVEFGGESVVSLLGAHDNLVILRTFSKWAGVAGLRLGYALLAPGLAEDLERIRPPYNVNAAAVVAALATFGDLDRVQATIERLVEERARLTDALRGIPYLEPLDSEANFVLCRVAGRPAGEVVEGLLDRGILVRDFSDPVMKDYVRISVGRPEQDDALLRALKSMA